MRFSKLHGLGNDYVFIDCWQESLPADIAVLARTLSDRHRGIGGDGLILILPPADPANHARMRMFNADGSEAEMCGNGLRCAAHLAWLHGHIPEQGIRFETGAGVLDVDLQIVAGTCQGAQIAMGAPRLQPAAVPVRHPGPGPLLQVRFVLPEGRNLDGLAVGMGNPHCVCFVPDADSYPVAQDGPLMEHDPRFPQRANIEFVSRLADHDGIPCLRQRTWERGSGITQACGTGACATTVAAMLDGRIPYGRARIRLDGGDLEIAWNGDADPVLMTGPSTLVFTGDYGS